jgi:hypothetical protein
VKAPFKQNKLKVQNSTTGCLVVKPKKSIGRVEFVFFSLSFLKGKKKKKKKKTFFHI